jgi:hypothetical protein
VRNYPTRFYQQLILRFQKKTPTGVSVFYSAPSGNLMWRMRYVTATV